jgi:cell division protein FtsB
VSAPTTDARPRAEVRPPATSNRASLTSRAVVLALVLGTLMIALSMPARAWFSQRSQIASLKSDVESAQLRVADLQIQQQRWSDPSFVAAEARRRLHFVLPGEVGYVTLGSPAAAASAAADAAAAPGAWYSSLWGALQEADDHAATPSP